MNDLVSVDAFSDFVSLIYDAAIIPERWADVVSRFRTVLSAQNADFGLYDIETTRPILSFKDGLDPYWLERQAEFHTEVLNLLVLAPAAADMPIAVISRDTAPAFLESLAYYREWAKPQRLVDSLGMTLLRTPQRVAQLAAARHEDVGVYQPQDIALCERLLPHLRRAAAITDLLNAAALKADLLSDAVDRLAKGIVMVDRRGRVLHANAAARRLGAAGDGLILSGTLSAVDRTSRAQLDAAIRMAADGEGAVPGTGRGIAIPRASGSPVVAHVLPILGGERARQLPNGAAVVFLAAADEDPHDPADMLAPVFDLTPAETRVLRQILRNADIPNVARSLDVAESTVRTHVRSLFEKTGVNRVSDLVGLAHRLAIPLRSD